MGTATPQGVIGQQPKEVQSLCMQFTQSYNKHRKTIAEWGRLLQAIRDSNLNAVYPDGKSLEATNKNGDPVDVQGQTFSNICRELGVPRSTAYHYINIFLVTTTYPEWLQDAATASNLNLAAQHVQDAFEAIRETLPAKPDAFQVGGIVAQLKAAKAPSADSEPLTQAELKSQIEKLMKRANKAGISAAVVYTTLEQAIAAAFGDGPVNVTREMAPIFRSQSQS
jgi:hypothetical protein